MHGEVWNPVVIICGGNAGCRIWKLFSRWTLISGLRGYESYASINSLMK